MSTRHNAPRGPQEAPGAPQPVPADESPKAVPISEADRAGVIVINVAAIVAETWADAITRGYA